MANWPELAVMLTQHPSVVVVIVVAVAAVLSVGIRHVCRLLGLLSCLRLIRHMVDQGREPSTIARVAGALTELQRPSGMKAVTEALEPAGQDHDRRENFITQPMVTPQRLAIAILKWLRLLRKG